ncbi:MAG: alginate export family protein [Candidatus Binatia bacterium]|nr:alginate export family protein [Candidatus Binatia bacterium]
MRKPTARLVLSLTVAFGALASPQPSRGEVVLSPVFAKLSLSGSMRLRWEFWRWFEPTGPQNNDYTFFAAVLRGGVKWTDEYFDITLEAQNASLLHLPDDAAAPPPAGLLGLGAAYYAHNRSQNDTGIFLRQGFLVVKRLGLAGLTLKGGRFEFSEGNEVLTHEPTLDWLKNVRLSQRLIGPFNFAHVGRSFDGLAGSFTRGPLNFTLMAAHPTQGGLDLAAMKKMDEIDVLYAAINLTRPVFMPNGDVRIFYIYYGDGRSVLKSDNRPAPVRAADPQDISLHTEGAHWIHVLPTSAGPFDFLAWGALQQGTWGFLEHFAWRWDVEAGWQPGALPWKPWLRVGYGRSAGDDDPHDDDHDTFFQILPTARLYAFTTFYNLMNNEDAFVQLILRPIAGLVWRTDFHNIRLSEARDLWYQGAGATLRARHVGFGFAGRPAFGERHLCRVLETSLTYAWSPHLEFTVYYAHVFGNAVVRKIFAGDQADFGYVEMVLKL